MAYSSGFSAVTGATFLASQYNTYTRDNFSALWIYTAAGDLAYATSPTTLARIAAPVVDYSIFHYSIGLGRPGWGTMSDLLTVQATVASQVTGDLLVASSATVMGRLPKGTALQYLRMNAGATTPEWATFPSTMPIISPRQGGSASDWSSPGTGSRTFSAVSIQVGAGTVVMSGSSPATGSLTVTFPTAFSDKPIILLSIKWSSPDIGTTEIVAWDSVTATNFVIKAEYGPSAATYGNVVVSWIAIGPP